MRSDADILLLDEPTAAIDAGAEAEVFEHFRELTRNRIAIVISHRFSTVRMTDQILVLDEGRIVEIRVMIRPLQAINLVHQQMGAALERMKPAG